MKTFISDMLRRGVITSNSTRNYLKRWLAALFFTFTITQVCAEFNVDWVQRIQTTPERRASAFLGSTQLPDGSIATVGTYSGNWIIETYAALINSDGTTRWQVVLDDPLKQQYAVHTVFGPRQVSIVADPDGNPTIAYDCGAPNSRTCLVKFRKTDGAVVWRNSPAPGIEGECVIAGAGSYGFYRFCPNVGGVRMFLWDGTVAWTAAETGYGKLLLPLTSGNFVRGYYDSYFLSGTMKVLSGQTGQVLYEIPVPGEIYDSYALDDGGFLLQTLRNPGSLPFRSTLDRYDGAGTLMWRHERADPALNNLSYSGQPLTVVADTVIRYTPSSAGDIRIATGLDGAFRWESAAAFNSELLNIDNRLYVKSYGGLGELLSPINYVDGSSLGTSLQIDGYRFSNSPISNGLLVVRQGNDTAGSYVLERYSAQIVRQWQAELLTTAPQIAARVPTTSSIFHLIILDKQV